MTTTISTKKQQEIQNIPKDRILCEKCNLAVIKKTFKTHCLSAKHIHGKIARLTQNMTRYKYK